MINIIKKQVPAIPRSKYQINTGGSKVIISDSGNTVQLPFTYNESGDLELINKKFYFNEQYINDEKIISWNEAVKIAHQHTNKSNLDSINQNLSTTSNPTFRGINSTDIINMNANHIWNTTGMHFKPYSDKWNILQDNGVNGISINCKLESYGLHNNGLLHMNNNNLWAVSNIDFNQYEKDGVVKWNTISNSNSDGLVTNCPFKVGGSFEMFGTNRDFYSYNYDLNIIHYRHDWTTGSKLSLTDTAVVTDNLTVRGALNCYELVANKVRATNGMLYVTDSDTVKYIYEGGAVVEWSNNIFQLGDIVLMQNFTGSEVKTKKIKITYVSPANPRQCNYQVWHPYRNEFVHRNDIDVSYWPTVNDYFVKIDSTDITRRTGIFLNPYDKGYIDFYTGNGNGDSKTITTSLGNLKHLNKEGVTGYGLYTDNAYIRGKIYATDLQFDGTIDGNKINAESMVVRNLKTSETGVKIEASGHDLKMLDANNEVKLLVTGDKYSNINSFVNSSGAGGNYNISAVKQGFGAFSGEGFISKESLLIATSHINIPATGQYSLVIPDINLNMNGYASVADVGGSGTLRGTIIVYNPLTGAVIKELLTNTIIVDSYESSANQTFKLNTTEVPVKNGDTVALGLKLKFNGMVPSESRGSVNMNGDISLGTIKYMTLQELSNNTTIFENGLGYKASTTKYAVIINSDDSGDPVFQARNGNTMFKIAPNGVFISDNGGSSWRKL